MGYVMVPVPEDHVEETMSYVLRLVARARQIPWDQDAVDAVFHEADEPTKSVLSAVARAASNGLSPVDHELAESIELQQREVLGIIRELNELAKADSRGALVLSRVETITLPNGRTREQRVLSMDPEIVELVRTAERSELSASPHPLLGDRG